MSQEPRRFETALVVARHGNTFEKGDVILRVGARSDLPLTAEGRAQGRRLGAKLTELGFRPSAFYSAPLRRTFETASEIASAQGLNAEPIVEDFLTELDYGEDDGRPETEVARRLGAIELTSSAELASDSPTLVPFDAATTETLEAAGLAALKRWDAEKRLPLGWAFLQERVDRLGDDWRAFAARVVERHAGETVVATTSNGIARFATALLPSGAPIPEKLKLATGAFGVFVWNGETWRLDAWNVR
ncbi:MAG: histidine phosphatase family protein [Thermoguttaceae bacterium]|nr:histidine phosphatase family protein [Thermoguttaceae bacterium]